METTRNVYNAADVTNIWDFCTGIEVFSISASLPNN